MKYSLLLLLFFLVASPLFAQDIIHTKNGKKIESKILEIGIKEIRYKRTDIPNGPVYVMLKSEVAEITYENGIKEVFNYLPTIKRNITGLQLHAALFGAGIAMTYERLNPRYRVGYKTRLILSGLEESFIGFDTTSPITALGVDGKFYLADNQPARFSYFIGGSIETGLGDFQDLYFSVGFVHGFNWVVGQRVVISVDNYLTINTIALALNFGITY